MQGRISILKGTLALVGSGEYLAPMDAVDRELLARLNGPARVVCLPTAAGTEGANRIGYWNQLGVEHFTRLGATAEAVEVIDRSTADDPLLAGKIAAANFVYLSGGKPAYLHTTLDGTLAWESILGVLAAGGVVAGCSAGAMIWGEIIPGFPVPWPWKEGFNALPGSVIIPHFDEISSGFAATLHTVLPRKKMMVGVEGNTALVLGSRGASVIGSGGVTIWDAGQNRRYQAGEIPPILL